MKIISALYHLLSEEKIILTYMGDITTDITNALLKNLKSEKGSFGEETAIKKKIYRIIVECLENICRHSIEIENRSRPSLFVIIKRKDHYQVISGNYIRNDMVNSIRSMIEAVNAMSQGGLKEKYREVLINGELSEKGGAGLGILDIAIKSGNKLEYDFLPDDKNCSLYILKVKVGLRGNFLENNIEKQI